MLYTKENKGLGATIERYTESLLFAVKMEEVITSLSVAKAPRKDGKENGYIDLVNGHMPLANAIQTASRRAFRNAF